MTSIIKLHAISGAMDESPPCYILQVDEVRFLLDCGWDEKFDPNFIKEVKKYVHTIDAVLLSYPDGLHLGALPYLVGKLGLNCPIYATIPVYKMGQMFMYDLFMSHYNMYDFDLFTLDDVDAAFDRIIQLKYNQSVSLKGKGYGITITPLPAGHLIGGTIWKIVKVGEEDIVYATDFNHKKERHLNGCELEKLQRPSLLIIDAFNARYQQARRRARDEKFMTNILQTLRNNGNVLVTVDTAGRVLELAHMLDQLWKNKESGLMAYSLALLNNVSYNVVEFAKSQIEWMSDKLMKSFEGARNNPFQFKHLRLCHTMADLAKVPSPKVVLASSADMESGFSRELFVQWANNVNNSIIITCRSSPGTLARDLIDNGGNGRKIEIDVRRRIDLEGAELEEYMRTEGEKHNRSIIKSDLNLDSSSDSEDELEMSVITGKHDIVVRPEGRSHTGFFKSSKKQYAMFPFHEEKIKFDEYGEIIQPDDYRVVDTGPDGVGEDNKENYQIKPEDIKKEKDSELTVLDKPTKCISNRKLVEVNAQVQFIDFEGRSDGESMLKILSQLRPRRVIVVRGSSSNTSHIAEHCQLNIGARVFTPSRNEVIDATTETHIYQVRLTEALVSQLEFQKGKDAEVSWIDAQIVIRNKQFSTEAEVDEESLGPLSGITNNATTNNVIAAATAAATDAPMDVDQVDGLEDKSDKQILTLEPLKNDELPAHNSVFINELKLIDFRQVLMKANINSEVSGGVLWCSNGTLALKRVDTGKVTIEGCLSEDYYKIRELLYEQYAIV
ncbi:probable cleavage and polyadenylation specificity factor subunit 2 [Malaya genurostris]|uniref:probable cleavage and polyadenylation specificity factor subunit 2 n=1 Tax=Malaya genurostris TaxID=325434 RepID=UPI0026F3DCE4|nr:probable cleavage and polyadenylation specificity factor subunit 2 [Malaya genurostris]XP_058465796.1 probable cleavage and polyadenylation specificity factor subunit 2 [Malaya genurostris]